MRQKVSVWAILFFLLYPLLAKAQVKIYQHDTTVKVYAYGREQTLAFCGGFNNPQFTMGDLNHDGLQDLVVYEPWNSVRTFINEGTAGNPNYRYAPEYALKFPPVVDYLVLADYNCDGIPDLFNQGSTGFEVYKGYYNSLNQLCFVFYQNLFYTNDPATHGPANAFNNPGDIPAIVDVDNDGDLDFVSYDIYGGVMNLYKNMRVEMGLPCDSIHIALKDLCWGKVYQGYYRTHYLDRSCDNSRLLRTSASGERTTHSGNTPCLFDWDMDGDYDYLDGSVSFNELTFLKNGRVENGGADSMVYEDTLWQTGGKMVSIPTFPAAFNVDVDQDGKKDILVAPNGRNGENYKCIWYYKNFSSPHAPDWRFQSDSFLTDMSIDLGTAAYPAFFDYDKDGKPDLFIGSDGYYQAGGTFKSRISFYLNTSTAGAPAFTLQTTDFLSLSSLNFAGTAPAFGDIDGDGIADMVIGHTDGTLSYFKNIAAYDTVTPNWSLQQLVLTDMSGATINVGGRAAPFIYDIDKDGKKDLIIGGSNGYIQYYQNVSTVPGNIKLQLVNTRLGHAKADSTRFSSCNSVPFIGKIDSSGIEYLLLGSNSGNIYQYTGFQSGDTTARYTMLDAHYSYIDSTYSQYNNPSYGIYDGLRSAVTVGDIANDGNYYMLVGNNKGGVDNYKLKTYIPVVDHTGVKNLDEHGKVLLYPNPANDVINVSWSGMLQPAVTISIVTVTGQVLYTTSAPSAATYTTISTATLSCGMYVCLVQSGVNRYYSKFTVIR
jgi:hypothetical protein